MYTTSLFKITVSESSKQFLYKEERSSLWISYNVKFYCAIHLVILKNIEKLHQT